MKKLWFRARMVWYMFLAIILVPIAILVETALGVWLGTISTLIQCRVLVRHLAKLILAGEAPADEVL